MKNLKGKKQPHTFWSAAVSVIMFCGVVAILFLGVFRFQRMSRQQELILTENALKKSVIQCYAIEGFYPSNISYLEDNYDLWIDYSKYNVYYECFSSNIMPEFEVYEK